MRREDYKFHQYASQTVRITISGEKNERQSKKIFPGCCIFWRRVFWIDGGLARGRASQRPTSSSRDRTRTPPQPVRQPQEKGSTTSRPRSAFADADSRLGGPAARDGRRRESFQAGRGTGEAKNRSVQNHRRLGLQRELPGADNPGAAGRPGAHYFLKQIAGIDFHSLARPRSAHRAGWRAVDQPKANRARRKIPLRIYSASGGNVFLPFARGDAGNDGHDWIFCGASGKKLQTTRRS